MHYFPQIFFKPKVRDVFYTWKLYDELFFADHMPHYIWDGMTDGKLYLMGFTPLLSNIQWNLWILCLIAYQPLLFNVLAILVEEQQWYYLIYNREDKGVYTFPKGISLQFKLIY